VSRWLITGAGGQLGSDLQAVLGADPGAELEALDRSALDLTDAAAVRSAIARVRPDVVINAAAYTAVDAAETDEQRAYAVNAQGPAWLAAATAEHGARLVHVSTDYVFDGAAAAPYETDAPAEPRTAYGRTKLAGELAVRALDPSSYVVRTAWVYGAVGGNFVKTMLRLAAERDTVSVVEDQVGAPTWSRDLAEGLVQLGRTLPDPGVYHLTNGGQTSWFGFTRAIFEEAGLDPARVLATTTAAFPRPAPRPAYSVLSLRRWAAAGLAPPPDWRAALSRALPAIQAAAI
jgi:dTDP-4-dehydrorhamnose reductase